MADLLDRNIVPRLGEDRPASLWLSNPLHRAPPGRFAPAFVLRAADGTVISSRDLLGKRVILIFIGQEGSVYLRALARRLIRIRERLHRADAELIAITPIAAETRLPVEPELGGVIVLGDVAGWVHRAFGAVDPGGQPAPSLFILDRWGRVLFRSLMGLGEPVPSLAIVMAILSLDLLA